MEGCFLTLIYKGGESIQLSGNTKADVYELLIRVGCVQDVKEAKLSDGKCAKDPFELLYPSTLEELRTAAIPAKYRNEVALLLAALDNKNDRDTQLLILKKSNGFSAKGPAWLSHLWYAVRASLNLPATLSVDSIKVESDDLYDQLLFRAAQCNDPETARSFTVTAWAVKMADAGAIDSCFTFISQIRGIIRVELAALVLRRLATKK